MTTVPSENVHKNCPRELCQRKPGVTALRELITWVAARAFDDGVDDLVAYERATQNGSPPVKGFRIVR